MPRRMGGQFRRRRPGGAIERPGLQHHRRGTNLVAADEGYRGIVLRFTGSAIAAEGNRVAAEAGRNCKRWSISQSAGDSPAWRRFPAFPARWAAAIYGNAGPMGAPSRKLPPG